MRIIGGKFKGRIFHPGKKFSARPTTDLAKEALFNILENRYEFPKLNVLDLFAGTGSIGYEFISRGAREVVFVEKNHQSTRFITDIVSQLEITNARVIRDDAFRFLKNCPTRFDIIFCDPPFSSPWIDKIPETVLSSGVLNQEGLLILEHPKNYDFSLSPAFTELRRYGKVHFSFFIS